jgi:hypothetical protein
MHRLFGNSALSAFEVGVDNAHLGGFIFCIDMMDSREDDFNVVRKCLIVPRRDRFLGAFGFAGLCW